MHEATMAASAGTEEVILVMHAQRVIDGRPVDLTGALVEFVWSTPTSAAGLDAWDVSVTSESQRLNQMVSDEGPIRFWVNASEYRGGAMWVYYGPTAGEQPVGAVVAAEVEIHVTTFTGGPPDRGFSAVEET